MGVLCLFLFCCALLCVLSSFATILKRKGELVALLLLSYESLVGVYVLWLFLTVPWVGLRCVIVVFPNHTRLKLKLLFEERIYKIIIWLLAIQPFMIFACPVMTLKAPITTAADDKFCDVFPNFRQK